MQITCLHTAQVHVQSFEKLFRNSGYNGKLDHVVRADLLDRARADGVAAVATDLRAAVGQMGPSDAVLCTCSTLGPLVDDLARTVPHLLRIDRPLMEQAVQVGGKVLVVICLASTQAATLDLFGAIATQTGCDPTHDLLLCDQAWPLFEAGDVDGFGRAIAHAVKAALMADPDVAVVVLGQASMTAAEPHLADIGMPVLSSPQLAVDRAMEIARS